MFCENVLTKHGTSDMMISLLNSFCLIGGVFLIREKSFYKTVFLLVLPMALQNLINVGLNMADTIMLSGFGEVTISGVAASNQMFFIMVMFVFGLSSGASILTAQYWGKGDTDAIGKIIGVAMRYSLILSTAFTVAIAAFPSQVLSIFTDDQAVIAEGVKYIGIMVFSFIFSAVSSSYLMIIRSVEKVMISLVI